MATIRSAQASDAASWLRLRRALWPEGSEADHRQEISAFLTGRASEPETVLLAEEAARVVGLVELSIRSFAEGCQSGRVAYLEGWFVESEARRRGIGRALVTAAEEWARSQGCSEFASDTQPSNGVSIAAHRALGFTDVGLVRCFRKDLQQLHKEDRDGARGVRREQLGSPALVDPWGYEVECGQAALLPACAAHDERRQMGRGEGGASGTIALPEDLNAL